MVSRSCFSGVENSRGRPLAVKLNVFDVVERLKGLPHVIYNNFSMIVIEVLYTIELILS